ncbi:hypothetical protein V6N12_049793 [Hibiscus sabdariffa]|uniref:Uncharacterized protein n=1 Tax=Hibiscus sabdariffa TaxID=183260 RepID=A0ABR2GBN2_9ROSI
MSCSWNPPPQDALKFNTYGIVNVKELRELRSLDLSDNENESFGSYSFEDRGTQFLTWYQSPKVLLVFNFLYCHFVTLCFFSLLKNVVFVPQIYCGRFGHVVQKCFHLFDQNYHGTSYNHSGNQSESYQGSTNLVGYSQQGNEGYLVFASGSNSSGRGFSSIFSGAGTSIESGPTVVHPVNSNSYWSPANDGAWNTEVPTNEAFPKEQVAIPVDVQEEVFSHDQSDVVVQSEQVANPIQPEPSFAGNRHSMTTRSKNGIRKPRVFNV